MSQPKWFNEKKPVKKTANKKEDKVYKHLNSGALSFKGDMSSEDTCIDVKSTKYKSIRVTEKMCKKLLDDSLSMGKPNSVFVLDLPEYYLVAKVVRKKEI